MLHVWCTVGTGTNKVRYRVGRYGTLIVHFDLSMQEIYWPDIVDSCIFCSRTERRRCNWQLRRTCAHHRASSACSTSHHNSAHQHCNVYRTVSSFMPYHTYWIWLSANFFFFVHRPIGTGTLSFFVIIKEYKIMTEIRVGYRWIHASTHTYSGYCSLKTKCNKYNVKFGNFVTFFRKNNCYQEPLRQGWAAWKTT